MLKIGVIGAGHLGSIHIKLLSNNNNINLAGIYDIDEKRASEISDLYNTRCFKTQKELILQCDCIIIASPTVYHYNIAEECLLNGKHCFIEKPITDSYSNALKLVNLAKILNLILQVGHVERFNPVMFALNKYNINPLFIEGHRLSQFKPRSLDVSVVHDLMIHDIDLVLMLVKSEIKNIEANGVAVITNTIDIANARINFKNGAVANLTSSRISASPMRKLRIFQKSNYFSLDFEKQDLKVFGLSNQAYEGMPYDIEKNIFMEQPDIPKINAIEQEHLSFIESIENNKPISVDGNQAAEALRIVEIINDLIENKRL